MWWQNTSTNLRMQLGLKAPGAAPGMRASSKKRQPTTASAGAASATERKKKMKLVASMVYGRGVEGRLNFYQKG